jgi:AAA domain
MTYSHTVDEPKSQDRPKLIANGITVRSPVIGVPVMGVGTPKPKITATTWTWQAPEKIKPRNWLYAMHYIRGALTGTVGKRGHGKSIRAIVEIASMITGRDLLGTGNMPSDKLRCWYVGEDERDEIERRFVAVFEHYGITEQDIGDRLMFDSLLDFPIGTFKLATVQGQKMVRNTVAIDGTLAAIKAKAIDVMTLDPLKRFHGVHESDNDQMDEVMTILTDIAHEATASIEFLHHTRKGLTSNANAAVTIDDARGADAIIAGPRDVRLLNQMTASEATNLGIALTERWRFARLDDGKQNLKPPGQAVWTELVSHFLPCGESVGVLQPWKLPQPFEGITKDDAVIAQELAQSAAYRADTRADNWFGNALGERLGLDPRKNPEHKAKLKRMIKTWIKNNVLIEKKDFDEHRHSKTFIRRGPTNLMQSEVYNDVQLDDCP